MFCWVVRERRRGGETEDGGWREENTGATGGFTLPVISTERELGESGDWSTCQLTNNPGPQHSQHRNLLHFQPRRNLRF